MISDVKAYERLFGDPSVIIDSLFFYEWCLSQVAKL